MEGVVARRSNKRGEGGLDESEDEAEEEVDDKDDNDKRCLSFKAGNKSGLKADSYWFVSNIGTGSKKAGAAPTDDTDEIDTGDVGDGGRTAVSLSIIYEIEDPKWVATPEVKSKEEE
ncbi:hypothetical protein EC973_001225 [Apophysomyces ossiformis]|uniref:Uncharacterized protein n=1 Tax=Apophysomyces ossiformis TaxID=679940 RepID=A0A8H7EMI6_9FUNG|nr:hypothetical protein EC973_001225 [Apophysomyces ossiformis]